MRLETAIVLDLRTQAVDLVDVTGGMLVARGSAFMKGELD
jgi:hypothetical protein